VKDIFCQGPIPVSIISESIGKHSQQTAIGGHSIFLGQIRADEKEGKKVVAIEYTAYNQMALEKMDQLREAIFAKHPIICMHVYHSLGLVKTGEICFFVFTSSAHRKAAMEACTEAVERIKTELPIWGKEFFEDDTHQWKENK
jgi:molybdopterin synthase catalytic subunit